MLYQGYVRFLSVGSLFFVHGLPSEMLRVSSTLLVNLDKGVEILPPPGPPSSGPLSDICSLSIQNQPASNDADTEIVLHEVLRRLLLNLYYEITLSSYPQISTRCFPKIYLRSGSSREAELRSYKGATANILRLMEQSLLLGQALSLSLDKPPQDK